MTEKVSVAGSTTLNEATKEKLRRTIERIERLNEERAEISESIKDVMAEAKAFGFDAKGIRRVIALRKIDRATREESDMILDLYLDAIGEF